MNEITVRTQAEFDALPKRFEVWTNIVIRDTNSRIEISARENSQVTARGNSQVTAWGNSQVTAWGNSQVTARENSQVTAWGNSQVTARGNVSIHMQSDRSSVVLFAFAVCIAVVKGKITKRSKTCTVVFPKPAIGVLGWLGAHGIRASKKVILFKRVSVDFKTQENNSNKTLWQIGTTLEHSAWNPEAQECGGGKFHACPFPYFCDDFRETAGDRYIAIEIAKSDLFAWKNPQYPHKIAFRKGTVLYECDRFGKKLGA